MDKQYTIDVVIPVYNGAQFISAAIDSVLAQSHLPASLIIVNDGSTDETEKIILGYQNTIIPIKYIKKENGGLSSARNTGIKFSQAEYLAFLDADDVWTKTNLEKQLDIFRKSIGLNLGLVYCDYSNIDSNGNLIENYSCFKLDQEIKGMVFKKLFLGNKIAGSGSAVLVRRQCFDQVDLFDEKLPGCEDWDMWLRITEKYTVDFVPEKLVKLRRHESSMQTDHFKMYQNQILIFNKWIGNPNVDEAILDYWERVYIFEIIVNLLRNLPQKNLFKALNLVMSAPTKKFFYRNKFKKLYWLLKRSFRSVFKK